MVAVEFEAQLKGYGLTTAEIIYRFPDHPGLLQQFLWQHYDLAPDFPELFKFLEFWDKSIEGPIHSVQIAHHKLIGPSEWRKADHSFGLH
ncbi:usg protein [Lutibaculum baratangense]|uniref:Usg-like protein n=1 Tax=Lutibaculum baratangense AMV1 TaxID=631454 RepID=V4QRW1_9HYPH|nr:usg protein [Lutibaculum baratangense]ESR22477.1 Usg-like protein [Lutibaculum baratangense AMV1]